MIDIDFSCSPEEWDDYVLHHDQGLVFHLSAWWESMACVYGLKAIPLAVRYRTAPCRIGGVLPLILFEAPERDGRLISLPYTDAAGVLADDAPMAQCLLLGALGMVAKLKAGHLEIRQMGENEKCRWDTLLADVEVTGVKYQAHDFKVGLRRRLPSSKEALWQDLGPKVRNQVRKAKKSGCRAVVGGAELLDAFYGVFSENMRDLGSPVHDRALFKTLDHRFADRMRMVVVMRKGVPAAAAAVFFHRGVLYNPWASSLRRFRSDCPNMLLYWTMLAHGVETGCGVFDFGRSSPGASTCRFKLQWGARMQPMTWHVFSRGNRQWDPAMESLVHEEVTTLTLEEARRTGPFKRRWISL